MMISKNIWVIFLVISAYVHEINIFGDELEIPLKVDFGTVYTGNKVPFSFKVRNISNEIIEVENIKTSCGCTTIVFSSTVIRAGAEIIINGELDTFQRLGKIEKQIRIYQKGRKSFYKLNVVGQSKPFPKKHMEINGKSIVSKDCIICHIEQGRNKFGYNLYLANCAMCHGIFRNGNTAGPLGEKELIKYNDIELLRKISLGSAKGMPGYYLKNNVGLSKKQIISLLDFLKGEEEHDKFRSRVKKKLTGSDLYQCECSSCHGKYRKGPIGPEITSLALKNMSKKNMTDILENGIPNTLMKSYRIQNGGVLSDEEIQLIVNYLIKKWR